MPDESSTSLTAREAIAAIQGHEAWAIIRRSTRAGDRDTVGVLGGTRSVVETEMRQVQETVQIRRGQRTVTVPFTVVQGPGGRWLVEVVDLEAAMDVRRG